MGALYGAGVVGGTVGGTVGVTVGNTDGSWVGYPVGAALGTPEAQQAIRVRIGCQPTGRVGAETDFGPLSWQRTQPSVKE